MKLYYSKTSPYSRKVLIVIYELEIVDKIEIMPVNPLEDPPDLNENNPLGKIPTLVLSNGDSIFDSPVIAEYLQRHFVNKAPLSLESYVSQQRLQALADGMMDATFSLVMELRRPEEQRSPFWQRRWEGAILRSIAEFERKYIDDARQWHLGSIAMACGLDYLAFRIPENDWKQ
ncbi:MAG: glutathione S-transferase N-terminal domain-containing protein [Rhizonema sp. NSF051]|nr:glutathione S-transferase N-terminal domain-containing protein [Rhizonema sp. NSF051]